MSEDLQNTPPDAIAIVGMTGRFPGASSIEEFWRLLRAGQEGLRELSEQELKEAGVGEELLGNSDYVRRTGTLDGIEEFDADFFDMPPREAEMMDPQHRLFLECAWEALEDAGYCPERYAGKIGVYAGSGLSTYLLNNIVGNEGLGETVSHLHLLMANSKDYLPTRVSYKLGLRGPSMNISTACSTSMVAIHQACQSLLDYHCDMALAGGAGISVPQRQGYLYQPAGIASPDGRCRAFDRQAQGTASGNGVGIVALKRLADAIEDGDSIRAVILGSAVNNDGSAKVGYTAPSVEGQSEVILDALEAADVPADTIGYIEAHGTGTSLGDPVEVAALSRAYRQRTKRRQFIPIGSVKSNIGHLDEAAGVAGLIKTVLSLQHHELPPSLHFESPNPEIDFQNSPVFVNDRLLPWERNGTPRRAGVSSFGIGGTNAHVVLEEAPPVAGRPSERGWHVLPVSARSEEALRRQQSRLAAALEQTPETEIADVAHTLGVGRRAFALRRTIVCRNCDEAITALKSVEGEPAASTREPAVVFMFTGQGSQFPAMGRRLYETEPIFRAEIERCAAFLDSGFGYDLKSVLLEETDATAEDAHHTAKWQPALFALEYGLARLWMHWGVSPKAMIGHSLGEYVAACLAGVMSLEDALQMVAVRSWLMQSQPQGAMSAVLMSEAEAAARLPAGVSIAAVNAAGSCVVSGTFADIEALEEQFETDGIGFRRLKTSHAFHSSMMEPILGEFEAALGGIEFHEPTIPFLSNLTGGWIEPGGIDANYWSRHLRSTVRFADGLNKLLTQFGAGCVFIEIGPGSTLTSLARKAGEEARTLTSLIPGRDAEEHLATSLGRAWEAGVNVDWAKRYERERRRRIPLPTYPFERKRYWIDAPSSRLPGNGAPGEATTDSNVQSPDISDWFHRPTWRKDDSEPARAPKAEGTSWLILAPWNVAVDQWIVGLEDRDAEIVRVSFGDAFAESEGGYTVVPDRVEDHQRLAEALAQRGFQPDHIVHLGCLEAAADSETRIVRGFYSLCFLTRALHTRDSVGEANLIVGATRAHRVLSDDASMPEHRMLAGALRAIAREYPNLQCRLIDGDEAGAPFWLEVESGRDLETAVRGGTRWLPDFEPASWSRPAAPNLPVGGVFLVTGGLGSMGLALAKRLASHGEINLVLIGRRPVPAREQWSERLREIESRAAGLLVLSADVADESDMRRVFEAISEKWGRLDGVIHTAGVLGQGLLQNKTREELAAILRPKVDGLRLMSQLLEASNLTPEWMVLCSSFAAFAPIAGQVEYAAANAYLNAFAEEHTRAGGCRTVSVVWNFWQELGMVEDAKIPEAHKREIVEGIRADGLTNAGEEAFERILFGADGTQIIVSPDPVRNLLSKDPDGAPPTVAGAEPVERPMSSGYPLFDRKLELPNGAWALAGGLSSARHWLVDEHRIDGHAVLPGTGYFEIVRAALFETLGLERLEFRNVYFLAPFAAPEESAREFRIALAPGAAGHEFRFFGRTDDGRWLEHARGEAQKADESDRPDDMDIEALKTRVAKGTKRGEACHPQAPEGFGPRWHCVANPILGDREGMAELTLDAAHADDLEVYRFHPALLDMATGLLALRDETGGGLPFAYERIRFFGPLPKRFFTQVTRKEDSAEGALTYCAHLIEPDGRVCAVAENYRIKSSGNERPDNAGESSFRLTLGQQGSLASLALRPDERRPPDAHEVEIEVEAAGLNFVEVLFALGMLPGSLDSVPRLGQECAGRIVAVGGQVKDFVVGDSVMAYAEGCFSRHVICDAAWVAKRPAELGAREAAAIPAAYCTAYYSLVTRGGLRRGEKVLIHSAAGGVGLAAINIAQSLGAEIYATAGSDEKRNYLRSLGIAHVMNSRNGDFAEEIRELTDGAGVDVVLNSLSGDLLRKGLEALAYYGRFLEIGKRDIYGNASLQLEPFQKFISFSVIDVGPEIPGFAELWSEVVQGFADGRFRPLPITVFSAARAQEAFEHMAGAKHIGKIVLLMDEDAAAGAAPDVARGWDELLGEFLRSLPGSGELSEVQTDEAAGDVAALLKGIWSALLGRESIADGDNFFELNGDSLLAAQVVSRVYQTLGVKLPLGAIFECPTIRALTDRIESIRRVTRKGPETSDDEEMETGEI